MKEKVEVVHDMLLLSGLRYILCCSVLVAIV